MDTLGHHKKINRLIKCRVFKEMLEIRKKVATEEKAVKMIF